MSRSSSGPVTRRRRKRTLKAAKGFWGTRSKNFRIAKQFVMKAGVYAFRDRKTKKRNFRGLWIIRVGAACDQRDMTYSQFMGALKRAGVALNRKMLSEIAISDPAAFDKIVEIARRHARSPAA